MAPEVIIIILFLWIVGDRIKSGKLEVDTFLGIAGLMAILIWGGFFNDTWRLICAGFAKIFN